MGLWVAVIPARYRSSRFPGKPLALIAGRPMLEHVWSACRRSGAFQRTLIATDDERIAQAARGFGAEVVMTSANCSSGTDRVAEAVAELPGVEVVLAVQGDEPTLQPEVLAQLARAFDDPKVQMATLIRPLQPQERVNLNVVKVVAAQNGDALYFSRADIPFERQPNPSLARYAHIGIYGFRRTILEKLSALPPSPLEQSESLEQLRAL
ncbi:MAG TPA: 3-deoxy-manno-octulosonate cytidylyltransferase, partial [Myxococcaceae bacterium]|nr:3-deoxy-manno-octulosonate cytidylyltransferase [Myxococcaceae bacterium]